MSPDSGSPTNTGGSSSILETSSSKEGVSVGTISMMGSSRGSIIVSPDSGSPVNTGVSVVS